MKIESILEEVVAGGRIDNDDALLVAHEAPLSLLGKAATEVRGRINGNRLWYNRNFHIEPTNLCRFACRFCSFRRPKGSPEAWDYTIEQMEQQARRYQNSPITEVHIVGGVHPDHNLDYYVELIGRIKQILPNVTIKAFTAIELGDMIERAALSYTDGLQLLQKAGMGAIPGGGAEIFDEQLRSRICPEKGSTRLWLDVHRAAHNLGLRTNCTILYGHIESWEQRIDHLSRLRTLQDQTGGFDAFIPLKFRSAGNSMSSAGEVSITEDMRMLALSRLYLDNIAHIKAYWVMYGLTATELALSFGADDIDGTIDDSTKIYSMAGAEDQHPALSIAQIEQMAKSAQMIATERDTFYNPIVH